MHQISKICHKNLHVSAIFCAHHQELSTVRTAIGTLHVGYVTSYNLSLLRSSHITCTKRTNCRVYSR